MPSNQDYVFDNWRDAAANAKGLFDAGHIDMDEYSKIMALAQREAASTPSQAAPAQPAPGNSQPIAPGTKALNGEPRPNSGSGRAQPVQSMPTWDQVMQFMRNLQGPGTAY